VLLAFLPTTCIVAYAYLHRPAIAFEIENGDMYRLPRSSPLAHLYAWIGQHTERDAMFILDPRHLISVGGNAPEFPAMTKRVMFTAESHSYMVAPHADAKLRHDLAVHLFDGEATDARDTAYLARFHRPIYLVVTNSDEAHGIAGLENRYGTAAFREGDVAIFPIR